MFEFSRVVFDVYTCVGTVVYEYASGFVNVSRAVSRRYAVLVPLNALMYRPSYVSELTYSGETGRRLVCKVVELNTYIFDSFWSGNI